MTTSDDQLLAQMARRNWVILAAYFLLSLFWRSVPVTQGVLAGGLISVIAYGWLYRSLVRALGAPEIQGPRGFQRSYIVRLAALAAVLFLLIAKGGVNPIALSVGLSVVLLNIFWTTFRRLY